MHPVHVYIDQNTIMHCMCRCTVTAWISCLNTRLRSWRPCQQQTASVNHADSNSSPPAPPACSGDDELMPGISSPVLLQLLLSEQSFSGSPRQDEDTLADQHTPPHHGLSSEEGTQATGSSDHGQQPLFCSPFSFG